MKTGEEACGQQTPGKVDERPIRLKTYTWALWGMWSVIVSASLIWNVYHTKQVILDLACSQARIAYEKDVIYRRWNAGHGGVFVPVTDKSPSNPYLEVPERDIATPSGASLTMMNPAYMTRQVHELAAKESGALGHITSLNPIRPGNAPDPWEAEALKAFQGGAKEVSSVEKMRGEPYLRLMRPLITEQGCLKCHAAQGYQLGDIRGGISVSLPMTPLAAIQRSQIGMLLFWHGLLWVCGLLGTRFVTRRLGQQITERKLAVESLRESEATLKSLFRAAPIGIGLVCSRVLTQANDQLCAMIGYSREELMGSSARILYPSEEEFEWVGREKYEQISQFGTGTVETRWQTKDGAIIDILLSSTPLDPTDLAAGVTFTALDITERKRAEAALIESQERFRELAELLPETVFETDMEGNLTYVNRNAFTHFGFSREDFERGLNCFNVVSPEDRPRALENARRVLGGESIGLTEYNALRKDGSSFPAILHSTQKIRDGKPVGLRGIVIDITDTKKLEAELMQANKMEAIGTLAGGIAHDFNNLLQAVHGYAELLLMDKTEEETGSKELQQISRAARRGADLTRQLLTFSRKVESKLQPIDLNRTVDNVRMLLERTIPKMIKIELHLMGSLHRVDADASQIEQILMNLAVNARDAMPDGGKLTIETKNVILDEDYRRTQPEVAPGRYVLLSIRDTGHGMDNTTVERIFEPFFTTKEVGKGTGLGLAMVYGIVKNHHGHVTCSSESGVGTTFKVYLPAVERAEESPCAVGPADERRGGSETILLVDDDESISGVAERILQKYGYTVISAKDGESALQIYRERGETIDLVILDLIMPGMGGALCLQRLLQSDPQVKVIIASGYSASGELEKALEVGAKAFIDKPYNVQKMLDVVHEVLG